MRRRSCCGDAGLPLQGPPPPPLRMEVSRRRTISLHQKLAIIALVERGEPQVGIARRFGISRSTVTEIKKSKGRIRQFLDAFGRDDGRGLQLTSMHFPRTDGQVAAAAQPGGQTAGPAPPRDSQQEQRDSDDWFVTQSAEEN